MCACLILQKKEREWQLYLSYRLTKYCVLSKASWEISICEYTPYSLRLNVLRKRLWVDSIFFTVTLMLGTPNSSFDITTLQ